MDTDSQGRFNVRRDLSGRIRIECPPVMVIPIDVAMQMVAAIVQTCGGEVVMADPGVTVIRGNGNGKVLR